jgi:HK97 family phage major capsid protein
MNTELSNKIDALKKQRRSVGDEIRALADLGDLKSGQQQRFDELTVAFDRMTADISRLELEDRVATDPDIKLTRGFGGASLDDNDGRRGGPQLLKRIADPWGERSFYDGPQELRDAALTVVDCGELSIDRGEAEDALPIEAEDRARIDKLLRQDRNGDLAAYVVATSRPAYLDAFNALLSGRGDLLSDQERAAVRAVEDTRVRQESRAALNTTGANGGYLIPFFLDPTIILTNASTQNPFRAISRVETIPTNVWHGVASTGVSAEWSAEAAEMTDASPSFTQPTITPIRADAYVQASWEVVADSNIAAQIGVLFGDAKANLEGTAFAVGTGVTQPTGIVTALQAITASRVSATTNGQFGAVDLFAMVNSLPARAQANAAWCAHWGIFNLVRQMGFTGGSASPAAVWTDLGPGQPGELLGAPAYKVSAMQSSLSTATASNDDVLVLGDFARGYMIVDRVGMEVRVNPFVLGSNRRPTGETGFAAFWRTGAGTQAAAADAFFRMLRV